MLDGDFFHPATPLDWRFSRKFLMLSTPPRRLVRSFRLIPLASLAVLAAAATGPAAAVGLDEAGATARFLAESPRVAAVRAAVRAAEAERVAAGVWPNPRLDAGREQIFSSGGPTEQSQVGLQVPVPIAGKRGLRQAVAQAGIEAAEARARHQISELVLEFRGAYASAYRHEAGVRTLEDGLATFRRLERVAEARAKAGEVAGYDVLRLRLARTELETQQAEARLLAATERAHLAGLLGAPLNGPLRLSAPGALPGVEALLTQAEAQRADVAMVRAEQERARLAATLADRDRWPDPDLAIGLRQTNEPTVQGIGYTAGVAWPLPLFDRGQAGVARAEAEVAEREAERLALEARLRVMLPLSRAVAVERAEAAARFRREVLARVPEVVSVAEVAYREGDQGLVALLDAHRAAMDARLRALDLELGAHTARLELERLLGSDPTPDTPRTSP